MPSKMARRVDVDCLRILALCAVSVVWSSLEESQSKLVTCTLNTSTHSQQYCMCKTSNKYTGEFTVECCYFVERPSLSGKRDSDTEESHDCDRSTGYRVSQLFDTVCLDYGYICSLPLPLTEAKVEGHIQNNDERFASNIKTPTELLEQYRNECIQCVSKISRLDMELNTQINVISDLNETLNTRIYEDINNLQQQLEYLGVFVHANVSYLSSTVSLLQTELNRIEENHNEFIKRVAENDQRLLNETSDFKRAQNVIKNEFEKRFIGVDEKLTEFADALEKNLDTQARMNHSLTTALPMLKENLLEVNARVQQIYVRLRSNRMHLLVMLNSTKSDFNGLVTILNSSFNAALTSIENRLEDVKYTMEQTLHEKINSLKEKHDEKIDALKQDIDTERLELTRQKEQLETANKILTQKIEQLEARFDENVALISINVSSNKAIIDVIYPNTFDKGAFVFVIMTLFVWIIVITIAFCRLKSNLRMELQGVRVAVTKDANLTRALHNAGLEKKLGIVYFNPSTKEIISKVLQQLRSRLPKEFPDRVLASDDDWVHVKNHENGLDLPNTKMCFMFAEFHERHVIIEEPGLGLGDLKRKTVEALNDAGVSIVILYVRHSSSKQLKEDRLYHEEIHCALHQPELKVFSDAGRFFSIYDACSPYQAQTLCAILQDSIA